MKRTLFAILLSFFVLQIAVGQNEIPDLGGGVTDRDVQADPLPSGADGKRLPMSLFSIPEFYAPGQTPDWGRPLRYQPFVFASNPVTVNAAGAVMPLVWKGGGILAMGSRTSYSGLMGVEQGELLATHTMGRLTLTGGVSAEKYGYYRGLQTVYGLTGVAVWRFSDNLALTVFGSWYSRTGFTGPAMMPYISTSSFGGYLSWDFAEHFGVDAGAQTQYNNYTRRWETRPIVRPYYKFSDGNKIGIDLGGMIYDAVDSRRARRSNPTMGPPIPMGPPPVRVDR